jgi:hypothetical protein
MPKVRFPAKKEKEKEKGGGKKKEEETSSHCLVGLGLRIVVEFGQPIVE